MPIEKNKGAVISNETQAMDAIRRAYLAHPTTMKVLRKFFLARRGSRRGFTNPPTITKDEMEGLMNLGIIRISKPPVGGAAEIAAWPMILECLDKVDADGNVIAKHVTAPPVPPPPSSRQSGPPSSRRSGRSSRLDREPTRADLFALAHEDDDDEITQLMDKNAMAANAAGMNEVQDQAT